MLFMGEEFAATTPFQFFCDFQGELATAVTEGRRREFAGFREFASPAAQARIPDPNDLATFERCKLDWDCLNEPQHKAWLEYYQHLLALRHTHIVPHLSGIRGGGEFELIGLSGLSVRWSLADGTQLTLLANLGNASVDCIPHITGTPIYQSQTDLAEIFSTGTLPPWCATWFRGGTT
jgi:1,4-alpha-glucan branching enzyme/maltooligosyltrehalose trehalohydrolase